MTASRVFDLGDILSVTTGILVSRRHIGGVYDILGYMVGEALMTHQLPRCQDECRPHLLGQHPDLADIEVPGWIDDDQTCARWLDSLVPVYGREREVHPVPADAHEVRDPIEELCDMMGAERVIVYPERPQPDVAGRNTGCPHGFGFEDCCGDPRECQEDG